MSHPPETTDWRLFRTVTPAGPGAVTEADGRHRRRNGRPLANVLSFEGEQTGLLATRLTPAPEDDPWDYSTILEATRADFTECPICGAAGPLTEEHVPPARLGGDVLTSTCRACNNIYGSYEDALLQRAEGRYTMVVRGRGIQGERRISDVILRMTPNHQVVMTTWNGFWPEWTDPMFTNAGIEFRLERRCHCLAYAAILKSGFLAACALNPHIITDPGSWPVAQLIRKQLVAWRAPAEDHLTSDPIFNRLHVRYDAPVRQTANVALCEATHRATGQRRHVIRLGWQLAIDWPVDAARLIPLKSSDPLGNI